MDVEVLMPDGTWDPARLLETDGESVLIEWRGEQGWYDEPSTWRHVEQP